MFTRRYTQIIASIASVMVLNFGLVSVGMCQKADADEVTPLIERAPDEIVVYGKKSVVILRNELYRAEESFFDFYNKLNSSDEFDVECKKRQRSIEERRREHRCMPSFALKYAAEASSGFHRDMHYGAWKGGAMSNFGDLEYQHRVRVMEKKMWAEIVDLAKSNPEFLEEIRALQRANRALDAERERRLAAK